MDLLDDEELLNVRRRGDGSAAKAAGQAPQGASSKVQENQALRDWSPPSAPAADAASKGPVADGTCPICTVRPGRRKCNACHRIVCTGDLWTMLGLCTECSTEQDIAHWHRPAAPEERNWLGGAKR
jgi:hypothetical protein